LPLMAATISARGLRKSNSQIEHAQLIALIGRLG
jgi:hypothetical protein